MYLCRKDSVIYSYCEFYTMKLFAFFAFLIVPSVSMGQFNSVTLRRPLYEVSTVDLNRGKSQEPSCDSDSVMHCEVVIPSMAIEDGSPDSALIRINRTYLSVCPPLDKICVTSSYGYRQDPINRRKRSMHAGLDLRASYEPVYAMFPGRVLKTGYDKRSGNHVTVQHGDYRISYCHLSKTTVKQGEYLRAGDVIGVSGNSGRSTGPHLHLSCRRGNKTVDPSILILYICDVRTRAIKEMTALLN